MVPLYPERNFQRKKSKGLVESVAPYIACEIWLNLQTNYIGWMNKKANYGQSSEILGLLFDANKRLLTPPAVFENCLKKY